MDEWMKAYPGPTPSCPPPSPPFRPSRGEGPDRQLSSRSDPRRRRDYRVHPPGRRDAGAPREKSARLYSAPPLKVPGTLEVSATVKIRGTRESLPEPLRVDFSCLRVTFIPPARLLTRPGRLLMRPGRLSHPWKVTFDASGKTFHACILLFTRAARLFGRGK